MSDKSREFLFAEFVNKTLRAFEADGIQLIYSGAAKFRATVDSDDTSNLWSLLKVQMFELMEGTSHTQIKNFHRHIDFYGFGANAVTIEEGKSTTFNLTFCV